MLGIAISVAAIAVTTPAFDDRDPSRVEFIPSPSVDTTEPGNGPASSDTPAAADPNSGYDEASVSTTLLIPAGTSDGRLDRNPITGDDELPGVLSLFHLDGVTPVASAVVVDGMVLTSASALEGAERVVFIVNGDPHEATIVGADPFTDVAVFAPDDPWELRSAIPASNPGELNDPIRLVASDGQPPQIVVAGKIIGIGETASTRDGHPVIGMLYTSARVPELSGGAALVNEDDEVIGLVIDSEHYLAVAVPIDTARAIGQTINETGFASRSWIGIEGRGEEGGVVITQVGPASPAESSGLTIDDRIVTVNNYPVSRMADIISWIRVVGEGGELTLEVVTDDKQWTASVVVGERLDDSSEP